MVLEGVVSSKGIPQSRNWQSFDLHFDFDFDITYAQSMRELSRFYASPVYRGGMLVDKTLLKCVLGVPHLLKDKEKTIFRQMLEDIEHGKVIGLSKAQRSWVQGVYDDHDLKTYYETHPIPAKVWIREAPPVKYSWEGNLPLKPPGRK